MQKAAMRWLDALDRWHKDDLEKMTGDDKEWDDRMQMVRRAVGKW
jgi:hypothetical protein